MKWNFSKIMRKKYRYNAHRRTGTEHFQFHD